VPLIVRLIANKLISMEFRQYSAFRVEGMPQAIVGEFVDPHDKVAWRVTVQRIN
jgi:hypothetical protein